MKELPLLKDIKNLGEREDILIQKLKQCEELCDFIALDADFARKEAKRKTLIEILDYISSRQGVLTPRVNEALIATISANLFRPIHVTVNNDPGFDPDEEVPRPEPSWPHLKNVYELLRRLVVSSDTDSKQLRRYITPSFVRSLLELFISDDFREREFLKIVVHRIYGKIMSLRLLIRKIIQQRFFLFTYESQHYNGIAELLEIMGSIINGFAIPLKKEHLTFLKRSMMPLHTSHWLKAYHVQLSFCVTQFVEKDLSLAPYVISTLLKMWPITHSRKQVIFLDELEGILEVTRPELFETIIQPLWTKLAQCISSPHFLVAERVLLFWRNDYIIDLIMRYRKEIIPLIYRSLRENIEGHWNPNVLNLSTQVRQMLYTMDAALCAQCENDCMRKNLQEKKQNMERKRAWEYADRLANARTANTS